MALQIVKGSDPSLEIMLQIQDCDKLLPHDLTGKTVEVKYKNSTGTVITKTTPTDVLIVDAVYGQLNLNLTDTDTEALAIGGLALDVYVTDAGKTLIWKFDKSLITVVDRIR